MASAASELPEVNALFVGVIWRLAVCYAIKVDSPRDWVSVVSCICGWGFPNAVFMSYVRIIM
jgi:hypothetical protein